MSAHVTCSEIGGRFISIPLPPFRDVLSVTEGRASSRIDTSHVGLVPSVTARAKCIDSNEVLKIQLIVDSAMVGDYWCRGPDVNPRSRNPRQSVRASLW